MIMGNKRTDTQSGIHDLTDASRPVIADEDSVDTWPAGDFSRISNKRSTMSARSPVHTAFLLIAIIFCTELAIMAIFSLTDVDEWTSELMRDFSDAVLLSLMAGILVHFLVVIPQQRTLEYTERINHLLHFLSRINQDTQGQRDSHALFDSVCSAAVKYGYFRFAWIGLLAADSGHLDVMAMNGNNEACMQAVHATKNKSASHCDIAIQALEQGKPAYCQMLSAGNCDSAWREILLSYGCRSCAAFPLYQNDLVVGIYAVYAGDYGFFHEDEIHILKESASDISFALTTIEQTHMRDHAAQILQKRIDELERFQRATAQREFRIKELRDKNTELQQQIAAMKDEKS